MTGSALVFTQEQWMGSEPRIKVLLYPIQTVLDLHELSFPLGYWWLT